MSKPTKSDFRRITGAAACAAATIVAQAGTAAVASTVQVDFAGAVDFVFEYEYGNAQPIPPGTTPLLPYFDGATRVRGSYSYDPAAAVDLAPLDPAAGQYLVPGQLVIELPDIGMTVATAGNLSFSVYTIGAGEFHVNGNAASFVGDAGGAMPFALSMVFYGPRTSDSLPTGPVNWQYGNLHVDLAEATPYRAMFFGVTPVPEPVTWATMLVGLGLLSGARKLALARSTG